MPNLIPKALKNPTGMLPIIQNMVIIIMLVLKSKLYATGPNDPIDNPLMTIFGDKTLRKEIIMNCHDVQIRELFQYL